MQVLTDPELELGKMKGDGFNQASALSVLMQAFSAFFNAREKDKKREGLVNFVM